MPPPPPPKTLPLRGGRVTVMEHPPPPSSSSPPAFYTDSHSSPFVTANRQPQQPHRSGGGGGGASTRPAAPSLTPSSAGRRPRSISPPAGEDPSLHQGGGPTTRRLSPAQTVSKSSYGPPLHPAAGSGDAAWGASQSKPSLSLVGAQQPQQRHWSDGENEPLIYPPPSTYSQQQQQPQQQRLLPSSRPQSPPSLSSHSHTPVVVRFEDDLVLPEGDHDEYRMVPSQAQHHQHGEEEQEEDQPPHIRPQWHAGAANRRPRPKLVLVYKPEEEEPPAAAAVAVGAEGSVIDDDPIVIPPPPSSDGPAAEPLHHHHHHDDRRIATQSPSRVDSLVSDAFSPKSGFGARSTMPSSYQLMLDGGDPSQADNSDVVHTTNHDEHNNNNNKNGPPPRDDDDDDDDDFFFQAAATRGRVTEPKSQDNTQANTNGADPAAGTTPPTSSAKASSALVVVKRLPNGGIEQPEMDFSLDTDVPPIAVRSPPPNAKRASKAVFTAKTLERLMAPKGKGTSKGGGLPPSVDAVEPTVVVRAAAATASMPHPSFQYNNGLLHHQAAPLSDDRRQLLDDLVAQEEDPSSVPPPVPPKSLRGEVQEGRANESHFFARLEAPSLGRTWQLALPRRGPLLLLLDGAGLPESGTLTMLVSPPSQWSAPLLLSETPLSLGLQPGTAACTTFVYRTESEVNEQLYRLQIEADAAAGLAHCAAYMDWLVRLSAKIPRRTFFEASEIFEDLG